jgi:hypothetical protein
MSSRGRIDDSAIYYRSAQPDAVTQCSFTKSCHPAKQIDAVSDYIDPAQRRIRYRAASKVGIAEGRIDAVNDLL